MNAYVVTVEEVHTKRITIFADSEEEAINFVEEGGGEEEEEEYSYTLDSDTWQVELIGTMCDGCNGDGIVKKDEKSKPQRCSQCDGEGIELLPEQENDPDNNEIH